MLKNLLFLFTILGGTLALIGMVFPPEARIGSRKARRPHIQRADFQKTLTAIDGALEKRWKRYELEPVEKADDLTIMRRLALALMGTIPSLEEIRLFEKQSKERRLLWYIDRVLHDPRYSDYMAERFTRATVGVKAGPFLVYRRRRYRAWLADQLRTNKAFSKIVTEMIATKGVWTDKPATNFLTVEILPDSNVPQAVPLAGRVSRTFLGIRMDCAECHDHPFEDWKQKDFHGLAAYFGQTRNSITGLQDKKELEYVLKTAGKPDLTINPSVPFLKELMPAKGSRRKRLAAWVTHKDNLYFSRAVANRVWAFMFGRPLIEPVDDMPTEGPYPEPLQILAEDFASHDHDLRRLITVIALSRAFQLDSKSSDESQITEDRDLHLACFPLTQLRPEQVVGAIVQNSSVTTIDRESFWFYRFLRVANENDFMRRYGDVGEDRFESGVGTIPQRLLLMNGQISRERGEAGPINSTGRIGFLASTDEKVVETIYLCTFTRRPTKEENLHFLAKLERAKKLGESQPKEDDEKGFRGQALEDIQWTLWNSTEFSWNH